MFCLFFITACFIDCSKLLEFLLTRVYIKQVFQIGFVSVPFLLFVNFKVCTHWVLNLKNECLDVQNFLLKPVIGTPDLLVENKKASIYFWWQTELSWQNTSCGATKFIKCVSLLQSQLLLSAWHKKSLFPESLYRHDSPSQLFITLHHIWSR